MPQFDIYTFQLQALLFLLTSGFAYNIFLYFFVARLALVLKTREKLYKRYLLTAPDRLDLYSRFIKTIL
jgi:hypothetical protein